MASFPSTTCIVCLNPNAALCARCKDANYCSPACQRADYPVHKVFCRDFPNHPRDPKKHRAFVFEPVKDAPRIVNHSCDYPIPTGDNYNGGPHSDLAFKRVARVIGSAYLRLPADQYDTLDYFIFTTNVRTGLKLKHTLVLFSRKDGGLQYADRGGKTIDPGVDIRMGFRCWTLSNLVSKAYDQTEYDLFGPFMLCSFGADGAPRDTTLEDLRHLVDYLGLCEQTRAEEWAQHHHALWLSMHGDKRVDRLIEGRVFVPTRAHPEIGYPDSANMGGLELHCANDMIVHKLPAMTPIGVTPDSPLWKSQSCGSVSPLSVMAGMPVRLEPNWRGPQHKHLCTSPNYYAAALMMRLEPHWSDEA
ncbi:hypothetical protein PG985_007966 [Apiospora marii]|uniref:uncharacterized protein n=1 Tax=Apiospora marii TaxID=335849 RepID=UPI0031314BAC